MNGLMKRELRGDFALTPALDLERHAPRALRIGLILALLLHATAVAYGKLMPPDRAPWQPPPPPEPIQFDLDREFLVPIPRRRPPASNSARAGSAAGPRTDPRHRAAPSAKTKPLARTSAARSPSNRHVRAPPPIAIPPPLPSPRGPDRSSPARLGGNVSWKCPFPREADPEMRHVVVRAQANVRPDGSAIAVTVLQDPGYGFGREARLCAMRHTYVPALGHDGAPAEGTTIPFSIHFDKY